MKALKWISISILLLIVLAFTTVYMGLWLSLPDLDNDLTATHIEKDVRILRDDLGTVTIEAESINDAAFALGFAHGQDRLFQIDLLRRNAAGELSEIIGQRAIEQDKKHRFHQFRKRAFNIFNAFSASEKSLLVAYANGVNAAAAQYSVKPFEYWLTSSEFSPWRPEDSLLVSYSMYLDLQQGQINRDFNFTGISQLTSPHLLAFFTQPSTYQATMDFSIERLSSTPEIPMPPPSEDSVTYLPYVPEEEPADIGSNNWAVSGNLTSNGQGALLSNDMHLGLNVPALWYKTQLKYTQQGQDIRITGVSLPGTPGVIVGATDKIAWGFTNSNVDNVDWVALTDDDAIRTEIEAIYVAGQNPVQYEIKMSDFGPVRYIDNKPFALKWVAHTDYAVNMGFSQLPLAANVYEALETAKLIRIPVQNMVIADHLGNVAWQLTGAITARTTPSKVAIPSSEYSALWDRNENSPANVINPAHGRVWSANARVVSTKDLPRYGDGGYALGARQQQIADQLMQGNGFTEQDFYNLQLDNRALFLMPWHNLLLQTLQQNPQLYEQDIIELENWQACACSDSAGYSLVRIFRNQVINEIIQPIRRKVEPSGIETGVLIRSIESAIWQLLREQPMNWLDDKYANYDEMLKAAYLKGKDKLIDRYSTPDKPSFSDITWGKVNALKVRHPFSSALGPLSGLVNMPEYPGFGDSFMPAVQSTSFGASERFIVQLGNLEDAILTIPGGQSMHPLSKYFDSNFSGYVEQQSVPLLPRTTEHQITLKAQ
ncbi:penicillin acylase family protein [Glaciecola sp. 1036]|uniref:penicillin acylase family protein n=1 Tax=Alteromonadaceae TaxID=72275 RepID=UPI003D0197E1